MLAHQWDPIAVHGRACRAVAHSEKLTTELAEENLIACFLLTISHEESAEACGLDQHPLFRRTFGGGFELIRTCNLNHGRYSFAGFS